VRDEIIYWHRRYYGPLTIAALVGVDHLLVQQTIWKYEEMMRSHRP